MNVSLRTLLVMSVVAALSGMASWAGAQDGDPEMQARQILRSAGLRGGLIVHVGIGDGRLTAALHQGDAFRVHGLDTDADNVEEARRFIRSAGLYGPVSVEQWDRPRLPYADNLVNLMIVGQLGSIPMSEVKRVLAPRGKAYIKHGDKWDTERKQVPPNVDEWTHYLHDAGGNPVAHDQVVGPPRYVQWVAQPRHTRSHEHTPSINALVSSQGRIFYIADHAPVASLQIAPEWRLVARDAYNGLLLWDRPIETWFPHIVNWGATPSHLQRQLIAVGNRLFVTLGLHSPVTALDATTGETIRTYERTRGAEEVIFEQGTLLVVVRGVTEQRSAELAKMTELTQAKHSPLFTRDTAQPHVDSFRNVENKTPRTILAIDAETGDVLWEKTGSDTSGLRSLTLCAAGDRVFYETSSEVVCVDQRSGDRVWSAPASGLRLVHDGGLYCAGGKNITVLSADNGEPRWSQTSLMVNIRDLFVANGSLWVGGFKPFPSKRGPSWGPYFVTHRDLTTGKVLMHIEPDNPGHHHRCYQNKATDRFILAGRRGTEFFDLETGELREHSWARGVCKYGVMPCNGLLYAPPHACGCYIGVKTNGFTALASVQEPIEADGGSGELELGPAGLAGSDVRGAESTSDWPTYRADAERSGSTRAAVGAKLQPKWRIRIGGKLSSPTVADGKVFVAGRDRHEVLAIDGDSGSTIWAFTAGGRIDSPPTIYNNQVIFGCRDGYVYCLRASDGAMRWRFGGEQAQRRIMADGQLESAWPAHGSVLVQDDVASFTRGRSSYVDGGIVLYRLDLRTGKVLSRTPVYSPDPQTHKQPPQSAPYAVPGVRSDILVGDGAQVYLRDMAFDAQGRQDSEPPPHLFTLTDFLDDQWAHRSYWIYGTRCSISTGCSGQARDLIYGRLLVFDESTLYGYGRAKVHWSNQLEDGAYRLFCTPREKKSLQWEKPVDIQVWALVLADDTLFAAGRNVAGKASLVATAASNGAPLSQIPLPVSPVLDGMAAVTGRLYLSLADGSLTCLEAEAK